ncbi:MAG TPA: LapA family protein [Thermodesulfobacteriota bacterium]|nr:LapA family protein [Thermodesulfobacteriota bacterium]
MIRIILAVLFVILVATFSASNREEISLRYFFGWSTGSFPIFLLILISLVAGMVLGFSVDWGERRKLRNKARRLGVQVKQLRKEIETRTAEETPPEPPSSLSEAPKTTPG